MKDDKAFDKWFNSLGIDAQPNYFDASEAWHASRSETVKEVIELLEEYKTEYLSTCGDIEG